MKSKTNPITGRKVGQGWWSSKYTDHECELCLVLREQGFTVRAIAEKMEMPRSVVGDIVAGRRGGVTEKAERRGRKDG